MSESLLTQARTVPLTFGPLREAHGNARLTGPCGDTMEFWVRLDEERVEFATFTTDGCEHSLRCGAAMAALACGHPLDERFALEPADILAVAGNIPEDSAHCAVLALNTFRSALEQALPATCDSDCANCAKGGCKDRKEASPAGSPADTASDIPAGPRGTAGVRRKILVLSGKGGVGKSTVAVHIAAGLARAGQKVGLLDIDIHGPSLPTMLGLTRASPEARGEWILPVPVPGLENLKVFSVGFMLRNPDDAVIWRGPMKSKAISQFLSDVYWGDLDCLVVDCPPGTGDEQISLIQELGNPEGAVVVSTPQEVAAADVRKSLNFCRKMELDIIGIVENMSGFVCPHCGKGTDIFHSGGAEQMAREARVPFLGRIPLESTLGRTCDQGLAWQAPGDGSPVAEAFAGIVRYLEYRNGLDSHWSPAKDRPPAALAARGTLKVAIPMSDGLLDLHFGHCDLMQVYEADRDARSFGNPSLLVPPPHEPGLLPQWLAERGIGMIIAGGMGSKARELFAARGIETITGAPCKAPSDLVQDWLDGTLETGPNNCDH